MQLSVIIVNYNVKYFLEQCLNSVKAASRNMEVEIFVVDNNSVDGSVGMVAEKFPEVKLIANKENLGFSKANNQAMRVSSGKYILLLNPDTLVEEDTFSKCIAFMDSHPEAGGLGVKMIDGAGHYLPESKRGFTTPEVAFYKISGLIKLFPKSKRFARYYMGHLSPEEVNEIDILAGAFMWMRKTVLDEVGLLDEDYFMYGEDIDLSYRIIKAGYKNYYFPKTRIIHYKGESTKKGSLNYVFTFYNAMDIFAKKHLSSGNARLFSVFIKMAIWLRASASFVKRILQNIWLPILDFICIWTGFYFLQLFWASHVISDDVNYYTPLFVTLFIPVYILIWMLSVFLNGGYDKPIHFGKILKGIAIGTVAILLFYSLLDAEYRFSRLLILLGSIWATIAIVALRYILHILSPENFQLSKDKTKHYLVVGNDLECSRIVNLLQNLDPLLEFAGRVTPPSGFEKIDTGIGSCNQLADIIRLHKIDEIIFCSKDIQPQEIISLMSDLQQTKVEYKIAPSESLFIIGSNSINAGEDLFVVGINSINAPANKRNKRIVDISVSFLFLLTFPVMIFIPAHKWSFLKNIFRVLFGKYTWVSYVGNYEHDKNLPKIAKGILHPSGAFPKQKLTGENVQRINMLYARNYKASTDFKIIFKNLKNLGV